MIAAEFNGHTHSDEFRIFYSLNDRSPINMAWIVGAATSYSDYNLNYKIATIDRNTYVSDILMYLLGIRESMLFIYDFFSYQL